MAMDALSQSDIDSLLGGGGSKAKTTARRADAARKAPATEVVLYNFIRPSRISKERQAILNAIHSRVGISLQSFLSSRLRQPTDVSVASVEQVTFGEFVMALSEPCAAFVIDLGEKVGSQAAVDIGTSLAQHLVDKLFGGPGEAFGMTRALTDLEQLVLKSIIERVMAYYQEAWGEYLPLQPTTVGFEGMPGTLQVASRDDNVLIANFEIKTGPETGMLTICIPLIALESFLQEKSGKTVGGQRSRIEDRDATRRQVERTLRQVGVPVTARLAQFGLAGSELSALRPGRVLLTPHHADADVELHINGQPRFEARVGQHRGHFGLRISQPTDGAPPARHSKGRLLP